MGTYTNDDLEILVATMNRSDLSFLEIMFQKPLDEIKTNLLIVNQSKEQEAHSKYDHIKVINVKQYGLSKSRNLAIANSTKTICWIMDDDCWVMENSVESIVAAHNEYRDEVITFKTHTPHGKDFWKYPDHSINLNRNKIKSVLSPEISFKRELLAAQKIDFDERFGLGAQFQDSENYIFLEDVMNKGLEVRFVPTVVVQHDEVTSSDAATSNRIIYARGALAGRRSIWTAAFYQFKYVFFLWRKGYEKSWLKLWEKAMVFKHGVNDYISGFEGHRIGHPKQ